MEDPSHSQLGSELAREQDEALGGKRVLEADLVADLGRARKQTARHKRHVAVVFGCLCVVVTTIVITVALEFPVVGYAVDAELPHETAASDFGRWVVAPASEPRVVRLTDGSSVTVGPNSRLRVVGTNRRGGTFTLESGSVELHVAGSRVTEYQVGAGPFTITMVEGRAQVAWDPMNELLVIEVRSGYAIIAGCQFESGRSLAAGRELEARCTRR